MPELKNTFIAGKMNKDQDERALPSNEYREALNIGVNTSEDSDVGAAQNILGNIQISCAIQGKEITGFPRKYAEATKHIAVIANPETDKIYRFTSTNGDFPILNPSNVWMDRIIEFDTTKPLSTPCSEVKQLNEGDNIYQVSIGGIEVANKEEAVLIDIYKVKTTTSMNSTNECSGADTVVTVSGNIFQLRHGMLIYDGTTILESDGVCVTRVNILSANSAELTLNTDTAVIPSGTLMTLEADRVLNFEPDRYITGINILDGMIFWTDNYSEPKKISIEKSKLGSSVKRSIEALEYGLQNFDQHTKLIVNKLTVEICVKILPNVCDGSELTTTFPKGCTDPTACNYDPIAVIDDGLCEFESCRG